MCVDLSSLDFAVLHEYVVGDDWYDKNDSDDRPEQEETIDDGGKEASRDASTQTWSKACVDLRASGARGQEANDKQNDRQRAHNCRYDNNNRLNDLDPFHFGLNLERGREHLNSYGQGSIQASAKDACTTYGDHSCYNGRERTSTYAVAAFSQGTCAIAGHLVFRIEQLTAHVSISISIAVVASRVAILKPESFALVSKSFLVHSTRIRLWKLFTFFPFYLSINLSNQQNLQI